jgi:hypothetical protein
MPTFGSRANVDAGSIDTLTDQRHLPQSAFMSRIDIARGGSGSKAAVSDSILSLFSKGLPGTKADPQGW